MLDYTFFSFLIDAPNFILIEFYLLIIYRFMFCNFKVFIILNI